MGKVRQHPRKTPSGGITTVREHYRRNERESLEAEFDRIEKELAEDLKVSRRELIDNIKTTHPDVDDVVAFFDEETGEYFAILTFDEDIMLHVFDPDGNTLDEVFLSEKTFNVLSHVFEGKKSPESMREDVVDVEIERGKHYPVFWDYAEEAYTKKELKEMAEKALPSIYPKSKLQRFIADDLDDIHRDINSLIASGDLTVKQRIALSKTAKTLQDIKTGEI